MSEVQCRGKEAEIVSELQRRGREADAEPEGATQRQKRLHIGQKGQRHPRRGCRSDAEGHRGCAEPQRADTVSFRLTQRLGELTLSFRLCWRGFRGAEFPNREVLLPDYFLCRVS